MIGIRDAPSSTKFRMAAKLGVEEKDLYVEFFGLNHLSWIRSVKVKGEEILPKLLADDEFLKKHSGIFHVRSRFVADDRIFCRMNISTTIIIGKSASNILKSGATRGQTIEQVNKQMMEELKAMDMDADPEGALQIFLYLYAGS